MVLTCSTTGWLELKQWSVNYWYFMFSNSNAIGYVTSNFIGQLHLQVRVNSMFYQWWKLGQTNVMAWSTKGTFLLSLFGHVDEEKEDVNVHRQWQTHTDDNIPNATFSDHDHRCPTIYNGNKRSLQNLLIILFGIWVIVHYP
jgi:hypothetical protein